MHLGTNFHGLENNWKHEDTFTGKNRFWLQDERVVKNSMMQFSAQKRSCPEYREMKEQWPPWVGATN
jgi:hypothetical protein